VKNNTHVHVARKSNNRVILSGDPYCCLLPQCEGLRTCRSGFPIATQELYSLVFRMSNKCKWLEMNRYLVFDLNTATFQYIDGFGCYHFCLTRFGLDWWYPLNLFATFGSVLELQVTVLISLSNPLRLFIVFL